MKILLIIFANFLGFCVCNHGKTMSFGHMDRWMIIDYHNTLRSDVRASNMFEISWDRHAAYKARRQSRSCDFQAPRGDGYGKTMFYSSSKPNELPKEVMMDAIQFWAKNKTDNIRHECGITRSCDYLQMVTANVEGVGCAIATCPVLNLGEDKKETNVNFVTCFYVPLIDIKNNAPYISGEPCTHCKAGFSCRNNLCSPPRIPVGKLNFGSEYDSNVIELNINVKTFKPPPPTTTTSPMIRFVSVGSTTEPTTQEPTVNRDVNRSLDPRQVELRQSTISRRYFDNRGHLRLNPDGSVSRHRTSGSSRRPSSSSRRNRRRQRTQRRRTSSNRRFAELVGRSGRVKRQARSDPNSRRRSARTRQQERLLRQQQQHRERMRRIEERRQQQERRRNELARIASSGSLTDNDQFYLLQMHNTIRQDGLTKLQWDSRLERWAKYVIRCDIQYPGPSNCYTNFGKIDTNRPAYNIVYDWSADTAIHNRPRDCRTPEDRTTCNRNLNMKRRGIRNMACASLSCGRQKQVTCIYQ